MEKGKYLIRSLLWLILATIIAYISINYIESRLEEKIQAELRNVNIEAEEINIDVIYSELELKRIRIRSILKQAGYSGAIGSVKLTGINFIKAFIKHDFSVDQVTVSGSSFTGRLPFPRELSSQKLSPFTADIGRILINQFDLKLENPDGECYSVKKGSLIINGFHVSKMDTISLRLINLQDFLAGELMITLSGKLYTCLTKGITYSAITNKLSVDSLFITPGLKDYNFTSRFKFQKNCIEASFSKINVQNFLPENYLRPLTLKSSYVEIGEMTMKIFRDRRKEFLHQKKPAFQDMLYNFPGMIRIDSVSLLNGKIIYKVHSEGSNEPGVMTINEISARMINLTNDTVYKRKSGFLELKANARLMESGKFAIHLKGRLFDKNNTLKIDGSLTDLPVSELNPILEKNASIYASGRIDAMNFSFVADNIKAKGKMTMIYHGLDIKVRNKRSDDTTSMKSRIFSFIANRRILDSNPSRGEIARIGIIDYQRDPERFLFHYCFRSILTGVASTVAKNEKKMKVMAGKSP